MPKQEENRCWKIHGVWGNESPKCPRLKEIVHCRNCEVFISRGRRLFERELPDAYKSSWTDILAVEKEDEHSNRRTLILFRVGSEWLSLPVSVFSEIVENQIPRSVPHRKNPVFLGLVNIYGELQLCFSMHRLLHLENTPAENFDQQYYRPLMIVINENSHKWVFPTDFIQGILRVHPEEMTNVPITVSKSHDSITKAIFKTDHGNVALLDEQSIFQKLKKCVQ